MSPSIVFYTYDTIKNQNYDSVIIQSLSYRKVVPKTIYLAFAPLLVLSKVFETLEMKL